MVVWLVKMKFFPKYDPCLMPFVFLPNKIKPTAYTVLTCSYMEIDLIELGNPTHEIK